MTQFNSFHGLCLNARNFSYSGYTIREEMIQQFTAAGLDDSYPFDSDTIRYDNEDDVRLNPARAAWVKDHATNPPTHQSAGLTEFYKAWYEWANAI